jgi:hypothetical protein
LLVTNRAEVFDEYFGTGPLHLSIHIHGAADHSDLTQLVSRCGLAESPLSVLSQLTNPYLNVFRSIIPLGGIDLSPILAFLLLSFLRKGIMAIAMVASSSYAAF